MSVITAQSIVDDVATGLLDETSVRWPAPEILGYLNDGEREIERVAPHLTSTTAEVRLVTGVSQSLPATAGRVLNDVNLPMLNKGVDGGVDGVAITIINERDLAAFDSNWQAGTPNAVAIHFIRNEKTPYKFKVYPPQPASPALVDITYSDIPTDITLGTVIKVSDRHANALRDYCMYRALAKESEVQNETKAASYYQLFTAGVGG